jgi:hypothetical protein
MRQNPAERLCQFVMREYGRRLTPKQLRGPWHHVGSYKGEISGVVVPADGESPSFRVMLVEIEGEHAGFTTDAPPVLELA